MKRVVCRWIRSTPRARVISWQNQQYSHVAMTNLCSTQRHRDGKRLVYADQCNQDIPEKLHLLKIRIHRKVAQHQYVCIYIYNPRVSTEFLWNFNTTPSPTRKPSSSGSSNRRRSCQMIGGTASPLSAWIMSTFSITNIRMLRCSHLAT